MTRFKYWASEIAGFMIFVCMGVVSVVLFLHFRDAAALALMLLVNVGLVGTASVYLFVLAWRGLSVENKNRVSRRLGNLVWGFIEKTLWLLVLLLIGRKT